MDSSELYRMCNRLASLSEAAKGDVEQEGGKVQCKRFPAQPQAIPQQITLLTPLPMPARFHRRWRSSCCRPWSSALRAAA